MRVLIVGCGYVGIPLGAELAKNGHEVFGLRRDAAAESELSTAGIKLLKADITQPAELARLPREFDCVVNCVASGGGTAEDYRKTYLLGTRHLIDWLRPVPLQKFIYTSSTGVYGQNDGSVVTEDDPAVPESETGKVLVETESVLREAVVKRNFPAIILRLAGIYGPGRGYWLRQFLSGEARIEGAGDRLLNMIHRDDVVGAIVAALNAAGTEILFNVVDNEPASQRTVFSWLSEKLGAPLPSSIPEDSTTTRRRGVTNKRVSNSRMRNYLGYKLKYPTFREGYTAELERQSAIRRQEG